MPARLSIAFPLRFLKDFKSLVVCRSAVIAAAGSGKGVTLGSAGGIADEPVPRLQANDATNRAVSEIRTALCLFIIPFHGLIIPSFYISKGTLFSDGSKSLCRYYCTGFTYFQS
jgi:hypothetical protein